MAEKVRLTQEEEIVEILRREGFEELAQNEVDKEPYRSIYKLPDCFDSASEIQEPAHMER